MQKKLPVQQVGGPYSPVFLNIRFVDTNGRGSPVCGVITPEMHLDTVAREIVARRYGRSRADFWRPLLGRNSK